MECEDVGVMTVMGIWDGTAIVTVVTIVNVTPDGEES